jgi:hypothetical protein
MDTNSAGPQASSDAHPHACPHCGSGGGGVANPMPAVCGMLLELAGFSLRWMRLVTEQAEAGPGPPTHEQAVVMEIVTRSTRRTLALTAKLHANSQKTPEERAAERAERMAKAERRRLQEKMHKVERGATAIIRRESGQSDCEHLLGDLHERLFYPDVDIALLREDVSAIVMGVLKDMGVAPKGEIWSDALMAREISAASDELARYEAERAAGIAAVAAGADWREGIEYSPVPEAETPSPDVPPRPPPDTG